jgi:glycine cleavage system aminomethyltransferase T
MENGHVPTEGAVVLADAGAPLGQVTSSRWSPVLERVIGMAWVAGELAGEGTEIGISDAGTTHRARVVVRPHYDPEGEVLRS